MAKHMDQLTGLADHSALVADLKQSIAAEDGVALAVLDLDFFMEINTHFGHDVGDQVLKTLASVLKETAPESSYRVSGDEFAVVMPGCSLEQAFLRAETIRFKVHEAYQGFQPSLGREVTVTIGVAQCPRDAKDDQSLMRVADAALSSAKEAGRNLVALPPNEEMVMKSCYYSVTAVRKLKGLAERVKRKESRLLREALDDLLRKYDQP
ncbi:MAG TPA: diguanylate cyclase [Symbiobacteriaceae bacterium]|jgi:diguanylate cyclase (GGDEF)-like protein